MITKNNKRKTEQDKKCFKKILEKKESKDIK